MLDLSEEFPVELLISLFMFNGVCSGFWCWKLRQKSLIPFETAVTLGKGHDKALSHCQNSLLSKQLNSFISFKMQHLGKILLNIARTGSFICSTERKSGTEYGIWNTMEEFWEEPSPAVRMTVSGGLRKNREGSSGLQVFLWCWVISS